MKREGKWSFVEKKECYLLRYKKFTILPLCGKDENSLGKQKISIYMKLMCILFSSSYSYLQGKSQVWKYHFSGQGFCFYSPPRIQMKCALSEYLNTCKSKPIWKYVSSLWLLRKAPKNIFKINKKQARCRGCEKMEDFRGKFEAEHTKEKIFFVILFIMRRHCVFCTFLDLLQSRYSDEISEIEQKF